MASDVGGRVALFQIKVFSKKKKVIICLTDVCANCGNVDSTQVACLNRRATNGDYQILILH